MSIAKSIRDFFDVLFPHRTVLQLNRELELARSQYLHMYEGMRHELSETRNVAAAQLESQKLDNVAAVKSLESQVEEARKERDYFRGRCERLELRLLPDPVARVVRTTGAVEPAGRKTFGQLQRENAERIKREIEQEAQTAAAKGLQ